MTRLVQRLVRCDRMPRGWRCIFEACHDGPCGGVPAWWNLKWRWRTRGWHS